MEFSNQLLEEINKQLGVKHYFMVSYHLASNGFVECTKRKISEVFCPVVSELLQMWEDWVPHVGASINSSMCEPTGQSP